MSGGASLLWQLQCAKGEARATVWQSESKALASPTSLASYALDVPADCEAEYLELTAVGGLGQGTSQVTVQSASLKRVVENFRLFISSVNVSRCISRLMSGATITVNVVMLVATPALLLAISE